MCLVSGTICIRNRKSSTRFPAESMTLDELQEHLGSFSRHHFDDEKAIVSNVRNMPGHAGFSYGFVVEGQ